MSALDKIDPPIVEADTMEPQPRNGRPEGTVVTADTARQGPEGSRVLKVMLVATIGALLVLAIAYGVFAAA